MPIYMKINDIKGDVTAEGYGSANGGVWKTSNFLTRDAAAATGPVARPKIKVYICPSDSSVVPISRISLSPGGGGVEGHDSAAKLKVEQMITSASRAPQGKLYLATNAGVYRSRFDGQGRLLVGTDGGVWRSINEQNNLRQIGIGVHNLASVEIIVTDTNGRIESVCRLENARMSRHPGGINVAFSDGSVKF